MFKARSMTCKRFSTLVLFAGSGIGRRAPADEFVVVVAQPVEQFPEAHPVPQLP
jgi:methyl coenzyme M reductase subunit C